MNRTDAKKALDRLIARAEADPDFALIFDAMIEIGLWVTPEDWDSALLSRVAVTAPWLIDHALMSRCVRRAS